MDTMLAVKMLRVSLPDEGGSLPFDNTRLLSVIADTFSRDKELRDVFVRMAQSGVCERMYLQRQSSGFASYVQDNMDSFQKNSPYASEVVHRAFALWAKTVCPAYTPLPKSTANAPVPCHHGGSTPPRNTPLSVVSKYKPPSIRPQPKHHSKVWRVVAIVLLVLVVVAVLAWLWMQFRLARIIICIVAVILLYMGFILLLNA